MQEVGQVVSASESVLAIELKQMMWAKYFQLLLSNIWKMGFAMFAGIVGSVYGSYGIVGSGICTVRGKHVFGI